MQAATELRLSSLRQALDRGETLMAVHYASGNLFKAKDCPVAVTCIAVTNLVDGSTQAFSMANASGQTSEDREVELLAEFFGFLSGHQDAKLLHWNMDKADYGFGALASRYKWLTKGTVPYRPPSDRMYDLDQFITEYYGEGYVPHPKLPNLAALNGVNQRYWMAGKDEADKADEGDYSAIQRSTSEKCRAIAELFGLFMSGAMATSNSAGRTKFAGADVDAVSLVLAVADRMLLVERSLKRRHAGRETLTVADEYDVQDLLRSLLVVFFDDVREESWSPEYAGASSRTDFILPNFSVAIEVKKSRDSMTSRIVGEELIVDRDKYANHPSVKHLVCLVLDHEGRLANPRGLESDLMRDSSKEGLAVTVRIVDR